MQSNWSKGAKKPWEFMDSMSVMLNKMYQTMELRGTEATAINTISYVRLLLQSVTSDVYSLIKHNPSP